MSKRSARRKDIPQPVSAAKTESYDVSLIINNYDSIVDELLQVLTSIMKLKVFPAFRDVRNRSYGFEEFNELNEFFHNNYESNVKASIKESKIVVAVVTNKFLKSDKCADLLKYARRIKKPIVGLIVEECENYQKLQTGLLKGFQLLCPIYQDRVNKSSYDQYLWIGEHFNEFLRHIATQVGKKFTKPRNINKAYYCFSINNETSLVETLRLFSLIYSQLEGKDHQIKYFERIPKSIQSVENIDKFLVDGRGYVDVSQMNVSDKLNKANNSSNIEFLDYYDAKLEYLNITNKSDYLNLVNLLEDLIDKAKELKLKLLDSPPSSSNTVKTSPEEQALDLQMREKFSEIYSRINNKFYSTKSIEEINPLNHFIRNNMLIKETFNGIIEELNSLEIDPLKIENVLRFLNRNNSYFLYETLIRSKIIIIFLTKEFFETEKYKILFEKFTKLRKKIYIVKLDEFDLNLAGRLKNSVKVYDVYKHKIDKFDGYLTRNLLSDVKEILKGKKYTTELQYKINVDIFMCNQEDNFNHLLYRLEENDFKIRNRMKIFDENELVDTVEKSRIIIFVLTNSYLRSSEFEKLLKASRNQRKVLIFLLAENIDTKLASEKFSINVNQLNVIKFDEQDFINNRESSHRLFYLIYSIIGRQDLVRFTKNSIKLESFKSHEMGNNDDEFVENRFRLPIHCLEIKKNLKEKSKEIGCIFYFKERNEVIIAIGDRLLIYDPNTFKFLRQISLRATSESEVKNIFYHDVKNKLCLLGDCTIYYLNVDTAEYNIETAINFDNLNSDYLNNSCLTLVALNNNKIYLYNLVMNDIIETSETRMTNIVTVREPNVSVKSMKFINNFLFILKLDCVLVYDLKLEYLTSFGHSIIFKAQCFFIDHKTPNYLYILDAHDKYLKVFNLSFKYIGRIKIESALDWTHPCNGDIINGNLVIFDMNSMFIQEIVYSSLNGDQNSLKHDSNGFYVCKLNRFNNHMCRNPYQLPCGNIACLECIYDNYNLFLNKFHCDFNDCGIEHELNNKLERINITDDNLKSICLYQTEYAANFPLFSDYLADKIESFENWFNFMDEDLDIRYESLNIQFDELEVNVLEIVDKTEERLLSKVYKSQELRAKRPKISKTVLKEINTIKNFPFKSINSMKKLDVGVMRDENKDLKNSIAEDIESSVNSDTDSDDYGSYMTDSDNYFDDYHHHHFHQFHGFHDYHDFDDEDDDDDSDNDPMDTCTIQ